MALDFQHWMSGELKNVGIVPRSPDDDGTPDENHFVEDLELDISGSDLGGTEDEVEREQGVADEEEGDGEMEA